MVINPHRYTSKPCGELSYTESYRLGMRCRSRQVSNNFWQYSVYEAILMQMRTVLQYGLSQNFNLNKKFNFDKSQNIFLQLLLVKLIEIADCCSIMVLPFYLFYNKPNHVCLNMTKNQQKWDTIMCPPHLKSEKIFKMKTQRFKKIFF